MDIIDIFNEVKGNVQGIYRSRLQTQVLLSLLNGKRSLAELRDITGSSSQALIPKIRILESKALIMPTDHGYYLTPMGEVFAGKISDSVITMGVLDKFKSFWEEHYLEGIPSPLRNNIGCLYNSEIISDRSVEIFNVYNNYLKMLSEADQIYGVTSIMGEGHAEMLAQRVLEGVPVELIITPEVARELQRPPYSDQIDALSTFSNFKIMVCDVDLMTGFTVTDKCISLGLYRSDGVTYDTTTDIFSYDEKAIGWGERLFDHYRKRSRAIQF